VESTQKASFAFQKINFMQQIQKALRELKSLHFLSYLSFTALLFVSLYIMFYEPLSFDGAFHAQAAKNLFNTGVFTLDYGSNSSIQTKVPFQIVNGLFLWLFGKSFAVASLANIFFYVLLWRLVVALGKRFDTNWGHLGFIAVSFSTPFIYFGFEGYGELASLVIGLWGVYYLAYKTDKLPYIVLGGFLIGAAVATKWVMALVAIPYGLVLLYFLFNKKYKLLMFSIVGLLAAFSVFWSIEYANTSTTAGKVFSSTLNQTNASSSGMYGSYGQRFTMFWKEFVRYSGRSSWAWIKVVAYVVIFAFSIKMLVEEFFNLKQKKLFSANRVFVLSVVAFLLIYVAWWFFLGSKPWYRRFINADVLFFVVAPVFFGAVSFINNKFEKVSKYAMFILLVFFSYNYVDVFFQRRSFIFKDIAKGSVELEAQMKAGLQKLPPDFNGFGYGWWQAPRWSFVARKTFRDIDHLSKFEKYSLLESGAKNYIFFESENSLDKGGYKSVHERYILKDIYSFSKGKIKEIVGIKGLDISVPIAQFIDFSKEDYKLIDGFYGRERNLFRWGKMKTEFLLSSHESGMFGATIMVPALKEFSKQELEIRVYFNNKLVHTYNTKKQGRNDINFQVDDEFLNKNIVIKLLASDCFNPKGDRRKLSFALYKAGFYGKAQLSFIDYSKHDEGLSNGLYNREARLFKWSSPRSSIQLASKNKATFHMEYKVASTKDYGKEFNLTVKFDGKVVQTVQHKAGGINEMTFDLPEEYKNKSVLIELEADARLQNISDRRKLSFAIYKIGFK